MNNKSDLLSISSEGKQMPEGFVGVRKKKLRAHCERCTASKSLTQNPKVFGVKFSWREIGRTFFPLKYEILSFGKCLNYWISGFQRGNIFLIVTILNWKDPLKYFFLFPNSIAGRLWVKTSCWMRQCFFSGSRLNQDVRFIRQKSLLLLTFSYRGPFLTEDKF